MRAAVVHSLPGRIRLRTNPDTLRACGSPAMAGMARELSEIPGVRSAALNPRTGSILLHYDTGLLDEKGLCGILGQIDLEALIASVPRTEEKEESSPGWAYIAYQLFRLFRPPALKPLFTILGAIPYIAEGLRSLGGMKMDVSLLDASVISLSLAQKNYSSASTLMMLLRTGQYLEQWARRRSRENLAAAISLKVGQVWVRRDGQDEQIPYSLLEPGDQVVLRAGTLIPVDGKVIEGNATVNESSMTGEPLAVSRTAGASVHAGTVIEEGELIVEVLRKGDDTRFQKIIQLIEDSEAAKAKTESRANELANKAVPFSFIAAGLTALLNGNFQKAQVVLSVDFSCAIKLSTPLVFISAMREGLNNGVFFKGGAPMEDFARVDTIVFDKTGTLTKAAPALERIIPYNGYKETEVLKIAACLEEHFPHPVAKAVVKHALEMGVEHREKHTTVKYIAAHGIATEYDGQLTLIGSRHFVSDDEGIDISIAAADEAAAAGEGRSVLYLAREGKLAGLLVIDDPLREEAMEVIAMLRKLGIKRIYLLSGDNKRTTERIARKLGADGFRGELLPQEKTDLVKALKKLGCAVAVVGDGMNDSPAMSAADVGIAMKDGADLARSVADITLRDPSLYPLVIARLMSQRAMKRIHDNTVTAISINSALILMSIFGNFTTTNSVWLHNLTTLGVSMNSMRPLLPEGKR
ncbi:heavy metal translocating P-type ATPase [Treponema primitia ZAS-2]|uniref:P-type Zn(2+) transporter n=1 Tax=Treponema primitia (strain ATCC BAA-887 / DSM 12427 / ZAS-2) TaxID=545694 RepID=F5YIT8_TREPZ|nr:heavy metal translocating P-type ATPase [Treponema primitia]AEF83576.1 heavy metal translocating P-type ATPase [Treponema primitia ZAS-2]